MLGNRPYHIALLIMALSVAGCATTGEPEDASLQANAWPMRAPDPGVPTENPY